MDRIDELMQRRAKLVDEARSVINKAESEDRALNSEESQENERINGELDQLESRIRNLKATREQQRSLAEAEVRDSAVLNPYADHGDPNLGSEERAYKAALNTYLRGKELSEDEKRDLVVGTASAGGYFVPTTFRNQLIESLEESSAIRNFATVLTTTSGETINMPQHVSPPVAEWVAEGGTKPEDDPVLGQIALGAHKNALIVKVSWELLQDSAFDVEAYVARQLGLAIGRLEGAAYATGASNSTTTPKGLMTSATVGVTAASATAITADEIISLIYSVDRPYRVNGRFLMNDALVGTIMKLKANSEYIWTQNNMQSGEPARLWGFPVEVDPNLDGSPAANDLPLAFGDFKGYVIRDVDGVRIQRLNELYAATNFVGFLGEHRTDGALVDTNAVKTLKMAAS